jgi:DNA-binding response OmpR family regulator
MTDRQRVRVLVVEDNKEFARLVELFLKRSESAAFDVVWRDSGAAALRELDGGERFDLILMDYFLPGQNGLEVARVLQGRGGVPPIVFLTVNKDFDLAVEALKLGVDDYLVKEEITTPILPQTILNVLERRRLAEERTGLEISRKRLEAIRQVVGEVTRHVTEPLAGMRTSVEALLEGAPEGQMKTYLGIIRDNVERIERKMARLKSLRTDRTVPYVRDIRMLDLSDEGQE